MDTAVIDDDDDDVIVLPNEEPVIEELDDDDDDEYVPSNVTREQMNIDLDEGNDKSENPTETALESDADIEIQEPNIPFTDLDNYVEKELPECSDEASQLSFLNVKIKEEPKDEDEDDGFEEVGTVLELPDEEITINSEDTQSQLVGNTEQAATTTTTEATTATTTIEDELNEETTEQLVNNMGNKIVDNMDGNPTVIEDKLNLSATGITPAPVIPLASLVNKIKINITKNITTTSTSNTTPTNANDETIQSNIPVICGGAATTTSNYTNTNQNCNSVLDDLDNAIINDNNGNNATSISSLGSLLPVEDTITYDLKPALQRVALKKTKKIECGVETSGLCSIM